VLLAVVAVAALLGSGWLTRQLTALIDALRKPAVRWGVVAAGGLFLLVGAGLAFEREDARALDRDLQDLEEVHGRPPSQPAAGVTAAGDHGTAIVPKVPISPRDPAALAGAESKVLDGAHLRGHTIRRGDASDHTNCHGWVFTGGRYLLSPDDVEVILKENGYWEVTEPAPGDLVVYRQGGTISHTGIVRYVTEGQPVLIESKWGVMGVFLHEADKSAYGSAYTFYRNARGSHLLAGFGGSPAPAGGARAAAAE
jgi:hypothetical protein